MSAVYHIHESYATVGARSDIDGAYPKVVVNTNRTNADGAVLKMSPKVARSLARQLNKWARAVDGLKR